MLVLAGSLRACCVESSHDLRPATLGALAGAELRGSEALRELLANSTERARARRGSPLVACNPNRSVYSTAPGLGRRLGLNAVASLRLRDG